MLTIIVIALIIGVLPGAIAQSKGHSFVAWWLFGAALFIVALPCSLMISNRKGAPAQSPAEYNPEYTPSMPAPSALPVFLKGDGGFDFDIVGEQSYQAALSGAAGGRSDDGVEVAVEVDLVHEPTNSYDGNAVRAVVNGQTVGYLSRSQAPDFKARLDRLGLGGRPTRCDGLIVGGWNRGGGDVGHFGLKLDLIWPVRPVA